MRESNVDVGIRRAEAQTGIPLRATCVAVAAFFIVAALLNGRHLYEGASKRQYGQVRTVWLAATTPLRLAATGLHLDFLRDHVEKIRSEK